jgi:hypothetical protein
MNDVGNILFSYHHFLSIIACIHIADAMMARKRELVGERERVMRASMNATVCVCLISIHGLFVHKLHKLHQMYCQL